jgi:hypothetical protein
MTFSALSAHAEEFQALKSAVAKADPHGNSEDRRSPETQRKTSSELRCLAARSTISVADPVLFGPGLGCCRLGPPASRTVISFASMSCALSCVNSTFAKHCSCRMVRSLP